ncbi:MAG: response regulator [Pirellulales bacterium]
MAALERLEHESYDVIITDLQMPGMTGLEFVRRLAQRPHGANHHDHRACVGAYRRRSDAARSVRLLGKTVRDRTTRAGRRERAGTRSRPGSRGDRRRRARRCGVHADRVE